MTARPHKRRVNGAVDLEGSVSSRIVASLSRGAAVR